MLLVKQPDRDTLRQIISDLFEQKLSREAIQSWQQAVQAQYGWDIPIARHAGYWYFYSLSLAALPLPTGFFLRQSDFAEYLVDMDRVAGEHLIDDVVHLRSHQVDHEAVRWPLAMIEDADELMTRVPGVRGIFERRMGMVEHCHLAFRGDQYLIVKEYDEMAGQLLLLGSNRDPQKASALLDALAVSNYMFP